MLNVTHQGWATKKSFPYKFPKTAKNGISFTFLSDWTISDLCLILERIVFKNCVKDHLKINYVELDMYT